MKALKRPIIYVVVAIISFLFLSWYFSDIFIYLVVSLVLSTILKPLTNYLSSQQFFNVRMPRALAVFLSFFSLIFVIYLLITIFVPLISDQVQIFMGIDLDKIISKIEKPLYGIEQFVMEYELADLEQGSLAANIKTGLKNFISEIEITSIIEEFLSLTGNFFVGLMAVTFITFFMLYEKGLLRKQIINLIPNEYFEVSIAGLYKIEKLLSNYLLGLLFQMTAIFSIAFTGLSLFNVDYAASIALFAAVINLIPYLGPILGAIFGIIVGMSSGGSNIFESNEYIFLIIKIASVFGVVQVTDNVILQPLIFSKSVKAHPLEIFIIIFAGATLAGIAGMIAAIPVYTIIRVFIMEVFRGYNSYRIFKV